jgi:hypothetical protein
MLKVNAMLILQNFFGWQEFLLKIFLSVLLNCMNIFKYICCFILVFTICSCKQQYPPAATPLEGAREFIDGCLKGDFNKATAYMIDDSENQKDLLKIKRDYDGKSEDQKHAYAIASINIIEDATLNDTTHIIDYKNSYDQFARKVKVVQRDGKWLVDFKYTFNGNL